MNGNITKQQFPQFLSNKPQTQLTCVKTDEPSIYSIVYTSINKFLTHPSENPQRMNISISQIPQKDVLSITIDEISKENAIALSDSRHFAAAFDAADNRKAVRKSCEQARNFYKEHVVSKNPFPPRQKIPVSLRDLRCLGKQWKEEAEILKSHQSQSEVSLQSVTSSLSLSSVSARSSRSSVLKSSNKIPTKRSRKSKKRLKVPNSIYSHGPDPKKSQQKERNLTRAEENRMVNIFSGNT